jgi:DNA-binding MarR family transcriptional regulator
MASVGYRGVVDAVHEPAELGWTLGVVYRAYLSFALEATGELPGGHRGFQVLLLSERGTCSTQQALAQLIGMDRTLMTYLIDDLERAGLVARRPDPADRRARQIVPTEHGRERLRDTREAMRIAEEQLIGSLPLEDRERLRDLLSRLAGTLSPGECPFQVAEEISTLQQAPSTAQS